MWKSGLQILNIKQKRHEEELYNHIPDFPPQHHGGMVRAFKRKEIQGMGWVKELLNVFMVALVFMPCLLVLNESDSIIPNLVGIGYICLLVSIARTNVCNKAVSRAYRAFLSMIGKDGKDND